MQTLNSITALQATIKNLKAEGKTIGFVPTMGNLHQGHLSLVETAQKHRDVTLVSIFVNPLQFGANEDLDKYPRTLEQDQTKLQSLNTDYLFFPSPQMMYPEGADNHTFVEVPFLSQLYCGIDRPGHFRGVTTIVNKLFHLVQPDVAVFGRKDFQQLAIIQKMVKDFYMPVKILSVETHREKNGLAMSSRNHFLTAEQKDSAGFLYQQLQSTKDQIIQGNKDYLALEEQAINNLKQAGFKPEYFNIRTQKRLVSPTPTETKLVILTASYYGKPRLIDNISFEIS